MLQENSIEPGTDITDSVVIIVAMDEFVVGLPVGSFQDDCPMTVRRGFVRTPCRKRASRPEVVRTLSADWLGGGKDRGRVGSGVIVVRFLRPGPAGS